MPSNFLVDKSTPIGLQLWSVRDFMEKDAVGTLTKLSKQGYKYVEGFGYNDGKWFGMSPSEMKKTLGGLGYDHEKWSPNDYPQNNIIRALKC